MKIAIVDDEPLARARLRAQVEESGAGEVVGEAGNGVEALRIVEALKPDVVLLDIRMPGMDGLEAAHHLAGAESPPAVVFTTAYDEHALAAFDANAVDYLLKPIRSERLRQALDKAGALSRARVRAVAEDTGADARTHVSAVVHGNLTLVAIEDVLCFQADQGYVDVVTASGSLLIEESLRSLENEFADRFLRVHRNALVAVAHVAGLKRDASGNNVVTIRGSDLELPVSRRLVNAVKSRLRQ